MVMGIEVLGVGGTLDSSSVPAYSKGFLCDLV